MGAEPGQMLLHYRLVEKIGEGGMGVVWKAVDTTLDREVAVKLLPEWGQSSGSGGGQFDAERLGRFQREAKLLASLNHANIAAIYGLHESEEGRRFLAMELVPGEDLSQRIARGPLPPEQAVAVARQIAEALEAAHDQGVVHRDLKPANVMLTPAGTVKVLDFGLAKMPESEGEGADLSASPTVTSVGSVAGVILGTAGYMSPEQAKGHVVDRRTDVWSFACILYEMLTGQRLFGGDTVSETMAAVLMKNPEWEALPAGTPPRVRRLLRRCLRRDPRSRLRDIGDARLVLEETLAGEDEEAVGVVEAPAPPSRRWRIHLVWGAVALLLAAIAVSTTGDDAGPTASPLRTFLLPVDVGDGGGLDHAEISPDGKRLVYVSNGKLWLRDLDRLEPRELTEGAGAQAPSWSPDSTQLVFGLDNRLVKMPASGGAPTELCEIKNRLNDAAWTEAGTIYLCLNDGPLLSVSARGGDPQAAIELGPGGIDFHGVGALPGEKGLLHVPHGPEGAGKLELWTDGETRELVSFDKQFLSSPRYSPTGHVLFTRAPQNAGLWALPFSIDTLQVSGEPFLVAADGETPSVAGDGTLVYLSVPTDEEQRVVYVDAEGKVTRGFDQTHQILWQPVFSPDFRTIAVAGQQNKIHNIWLHDVDRDTKTRLTFGDGIDGCQAWSPDGRTVYYSTPLFTSEIAVWRVDADGRSDPERITNGCISDVHPNGRHLLIDQTNLGAAVPRGIVLYDLETGEETVFVDTEQLEGGAAVSPDGNLVAYGSNESGRWEVYLTTFPNAGGKWQVSARGGGIPVWGLDEKLYFVSGANEVMSVRVETSPELRLGRAEALFSATTENTLFRRRFDISRDGEFLAVQNVVQEGEEARESGIVVVENWARAFE